MTTKTHRYLASISVASALVAAALAAPAQAKNPWPKAEKIETTEFEHYGLVPVDDSGRIVVVGTNPVDVVNLDSGARERVDVFPSDEPAAGEVSTFGHAISGDGRFVLFAALRSDPQTGEQPPVGQYELYLRDREQQSTTRIAQIKGQKQPMDAPSAAISSTGEYVSFLNGGDVYRYRVSTGESTRLTESADASTMAMDAAGDTIVFAADSPSLVARDTNQATDIFKLQTATKEVTRVSVAADGTQADADSTNPDISDDGLVTVFDSAATNLRPIAPEDRAGITRMAYVVDERQGTIRLVNPLRRPTKEGQTTSFGDPAVSGDGSHIVYTFTRFVRGEPEPIPEYDPGYVELTGLQIFDRTVDTRRWISEAYTEEAPSETMPSINGDGRYITYGWREPDWTLDFPYITDRGPANERY